MKSDHDEAVSTVIALMLVLAILATCIAIYSATYIPGLKQQSEILHSGEVQYTFLRLSSDIDNLYSLGKPAQFSEPVLLGGGDILLSPVKSSGTLELTENQIGILNITGNDKPLIIIKGDDNIQVDCNENTLTLSSNVEVNSFINIFCENSLGIIIPVLIRG